MLQCGLYIDEYNTIISDVVGTEKKSITYQISFSAQKSSINVTGDGPVISVFSVGYCIARNHDRRNLGRGCSPFDSTHMKILHHEEYRDYYTFYLEKKT